LDGDLVRNKNKINAYSLFPNNVGKISEKQIENNCQKEIRCRTLGRSASLPSSDARGLFFQMPSYLL
jgi:hypothetical protein